MPALQAWEDKLRRSERIIERQNRNVAEPEEVIYMNVKLPAENLTFRVAPAKYKREIYFKANE